MRGLILFLVFGIVVAGYGYRKNPDACSKLGRDIVQDAKTIYDPDYNLSNQERTLGISPPPVGAAAPDAHQPVAPDDDFEIPPAMRGFDTEDYSLAVRAAKQKGKKLLLFFTGSDYCPPCQLAVSEIFPTAEFQNWVSSKYIMVTLDFPKFQSQPAGLKAQNDALHQKYHIQGVPTFITTEVDGTEIKRTLGGFVAANMFPLYFENNGPVTLVPVPH